MTSTRLTRRDIAAYAFLALPLSFAGLPLYIHAPDFYTRDLGLNIGILGAILLCIRLFDAVQDPIIGYLTDRYPHRRYAIMVAGALILLLGVGGVFYGPQMAVPAALWFTLTMILATTGFSIVSINLTMIGGFMDDNDSERTRISAWREGFGLAGLLLAAILPTALQNHTDPAISYMALTWCFTLLLLAAMIAFRRFVMTNRALFSASAHDKTNGGFAFLSILKGPHKLFLSISFLSYLAASIPSVTVLFFIRDYLQADAYAGLYLVIYFLSGAAFIGVWVRLAHEVGQRRSWLFSMILSIITFVWAYALQPGDLIAYGVICALSGIALGADLAMPPAMIAERITRHNDRRAATQYYALLAFLPKVSIALAGGLSLLALDALAFEAGTANPPQALNGLITIYALVPCIIKAVSAYLLYRLINKEGDTHEHFERSTVNGSSINS